MFTLHFLCDMNLCAQRTSTLARGVHLELPVRQLAQLGGVRLRRRRPGRRPARLPVPHHDMASLKLNGCTGPSHSDPPARPAMLKDAFVSRDAIGIRIVPQPSSAGRTRTEGYFFWLPLIG